MLMTALVSLYLTAAVPKPFTEVASVEGVTEYRLPNGLRVLFVPDESVANVTVNLTVLVGSRHEGYGEKGMAHLLEHMLFKGSPKFKDPKKEMGARGAQLERHHPRRPHQLLRDAPRQRRQRRLRAALRGRPPASTPSSTRRTSTPR